MKLHTSCKFCRRPIEMDVDEAGFQSPIINAKLWLANIACNRCATFYKTRSAISERIGKNCELLLNSRRTGKRDNEIEVAVCDQLTKLTKQLAKIVCEFHSLETQWDSEFVDNLMQAPAKFSLVLNIYAKGIRQIRERMVTA